MQMRPRTKGIVGTRPSEPTGELYQQAKQLLKAKADRLAADRARKAAIPVPNRICYANTAFKNWKPGMRVPPCRVCGGLLFPEENHECPGFTPKYVEHDEEWEQHQEAKSEAIRESNLRAPLTCAGCGDEITCDDDAIYHDENCGQGGEREMRSLRGDEDDLSGYEDYVEPDYCEGDDDGYDCD
jgi:hypothetical protein